MNRRSVVVLVLGLGILGSSRAGAQDKGKISPKFTSTDRGFVGINFTPDGSSLAVCGEGFAEILDLATLKTSKSFKLRGLIDEVAFDPAMRVMVARGKAVDTMLMDTETWIQVKARVKLPVGTFETRPWLAGLPPAGASVDGPSARLMSNGVQTNSDAWSADRWVRFAENPLGSCPAAFSADGRWLALANGQKGIRLWDMTSYWRRKDILEFPDFAEGRLEHANALAFHARYLILGEENGYVTPLVLQRWEAQAAGTLDPSTGPSVTRRDHDAFRRHSGHVTSVSFSPDGLRCFSAGLDEKVCAWSLDQIVSPNPAKPEWTVPGHYALLAPDGAQLAVAEEKGIRIYDVARRALSGWIPTDPKAGRLVRLRFNPTGSLLASVSCACEDCVPRKGDDVSLASYKNRPRRVHQHGGRLDIWAFPPEAK